MVVSCQVIEHLKEKDVGKYLEDISKKYLRAGGIFICSTPNKSVTSPDLRKPIMIFHEKEYTPAELRNLLEKFFKDVVIFGQCDESIVQLSEIYSSGGALSWRAKTLRIISQIEIVRTISRHLPMFIKYVFMGWPPDDKKINYVLLQERQGFSKCVNLIARCEN